MFSTDVGHKTGLDIKSSLNTLATMGLTGESQTNMVYVQWDSAVSP